MNKVSEKFVGGGFSLALLLISVVAATSYLSIQRLTAQKQWVVHTQQVTESIARVPIHLGNAESAQNSYIFTENTLYREAYKQQKQKVYQLLKDMRRLSSDNPNQQKRLDTLEPLVAEKFSLLEQSIDLFKEKSLDKATQRSIVDRSVEIGKQIQAISQAIENKEKTLLQGETSATEDLFQEIVIIVSLGYIFSLVLLIVVYSLLQKQIQMNKVLSQEAICMEQQAAKAKLADILETITDAFVALDPNSCYTYINHKAEQIFNCHTTDLIGKSIWEVFPETCKYKFYQFYHQAVTEQRVIHMEEYYAPFDRWVEYCMYPSTEGVSILFQDVTRRKSAEIALEASERRYRSLIIATSQAVWIADKNGMINEQSDVQIKEGEWLNAIHPEDRELTELLWTEAVKTKNLYFSEYRVRVADGSYRFFAARGVPILNTNNEIQEWIGTCTDITERKLAQQALQQINDELEIKVQERTAELQKLNEDLKRSNQELEQFAYVASHDLQEPLRSVTSYTQLLEKEYQHRLNDSAQEYLAYIVDGAKRMQQLIQDLLAYSRVGTCTQEFVLVDCNMALSLALSNLHVAIAESKAIITHDPLPKLLADKTQMVQLFQNLVGNAIKFCPKEPPKIHIGALRRDGETGEVAREFLTPNSPFPIPDSQWLIWVQDNGIGIKSRYLKRIFEVFRRLHTRREFPGTGIGLAICKKIVERHGGCIWAESEPGVGTVFYFTLNTD
ncbi:histidine kinase [Nostoc linckia z18]|uniref:histidine kinase n=2 Tax=Nostoc linckia TaxID=92942 RepID=A0A9Q6EMT0_NOSLI|nr:CHASE3 domain-containing protein [Nostoc linckia]PHK29773.1 histidine kinase [Nostoc linckia z15]PHK46275.1 histidine kinase [Nostoc linckia z16]PHJ66530.1 histidine kinase [Nostoc linckia z1]PHJ71405.1 histidine kinase [Nostoc linckia z3]PHJ75437.1 histidine kinase [Nostoc linckia z2]